MDGKGLELNHMYQQSLQRWASGDQRIRCILHLHQHVSCRRISKSGRKRKSQHSFLHFARKRQTYLDTYDLLGELHQEDRNSNSVRHLSLRGFGNIISNDMRTINPIFSISSNIVLVQPLDGISVIHSHEGTLRGLERLTGGPEGINDRFGFWVG